MELDKQIKAVEEILFNCVDTLQVNNKTLRYRSVEELIVIRDYLLSLKKTG